MNQPSQKIIQIGAVALHINSEHMEFSSQFTAYVNPREPLDPFIADLCGVNQETLDRAKPFHEVVNDFDEWIKEHGCHLAIAWGGDWHWLQDQAQCTLVRKILDLKAMYSLLTSDQPAKKQSRGLRGAIEHSGLHFEGIQHDALMDAINTSWLLIHMIERYGFFGKAEKLVQLARNN